MNAGCELPNLTDGFNGEAPDLGAYELGQPLPNYGPRGGDGSDWLNHGGQKAFSLGHRGNGDLLGFKFGVWEGGHRVPFIARWPGKIKSGTTSTQLISGVDTNHP